MQAEDVRDSAPSFPTISANQGTTEYSVYSNHMLAIRVRGDSFGVHAFME